MNATCATIDQHLELFLPHFDIVDRRRASVPAPTQVVFQTACNLELESIWLVRWIIRTREFLFRAKKDAKSRETPRGLVAQSKAIGWAVLSETPGREIVMGAVTQPWLGDVEFRPLGPAEFTAFHEPGFVRIVWGLRADPGEDGRTILTAETRAEATDPGSRKKFRDYWRIVSPGVRLIRLMLLREIRKRASSYQEISIP